jgi:cell division initiation protein
MSITPVEVRHAQLSRGLFGYSRTATDNLLEAIAQSYEQTWWERADLRDEVERLQAELTRFREMERLLRDTMMSAEKAAEDVRGQARREYDLLLQEARLKAREIVMEAEAEREKVRSEIRSLRSARSELRSSYRSFLQAALDRLDDELDEAPPAIESAKVGLSENGAPRQLEPPDDDASEDTEAPTHAA